MNQNILFELEHNKKRLDYYQTKLESLDEDQSASKWVEIYADRVKALESKASKLLGEAPEGLH